MPVSAACATAMSSARTASCDPQRSTPMKTAFVNLGRIVTGDWRDPLVQGDTLITANGLIQQVGTAPSAEVEACDVVIDADGATAIPGLIGSQVHNTFGD